MLVAALFAWLLAAALLVVSSRLLRAHAVPEPRAGDGCAGLSVVVAAHDEAPRIGALLRDLRAQDHPDFEVIVVDDRSRDGTGHAVRRAAGHDPRVRLVRVDARPPGWQGRLYAQGVGARLARGTWLLFLSADQRLATRTFLRSLVAEYERTDAAAVSVVGPFVGARWWERACFHPLLNHPVLWGVVLGVQRLRPRATWLIGALGLRRVTYLALGGASGAAACAAGGFDDWGWARACARAGLRTRMVHHGGLLDVSNWTDFRTFWHGLARWQAGLFTYRRAGWVAAATLAAAVSGLLVASVDVVADLVSGRAPAAPSAVLATIPILLGAGYTRAQRLPTGVALGFHAVGAFLLASLAAAAWARLRNRVRWRDEVMAVVAATPAFAEGDKRHTGRRHGAKPVALHL